MRFLVNLQKIDRRIMYLLLAALIFITLRWGLVRMPLPVMDEVKGVYNTIDSIPNDKIKGKIVVISIMWNAGTQAENRTQLEVVARHMFMRGVPFAIVPWDQQGTQIADKTVRDVAKELHKTYGKDWINIGYRPPTNYEMQILSMGQDTWRAWGKDMNGTPMSQIPMMKGVRNAQKFGMVLETTGSATLPAWISFMGQTYKVPIAYGPTAVMVPEGYNYVDTGQIVGMIPGLVGAAQYDEMLHHRGFAARGADALSMAHLLIIVLIILGNLGYFISRRQTAREQEG